MLKKMFVSWRKAIRRLFNLPYTTHRCLLPLLCHDQPVEQQIHKRSIYFIHSLSQSNNPIISLCYQLALFGSQSPISNNLSFLSYFYRIPRENVHSISPISPEPDDDTSRKAVFIEDLIWILYDFDIHTCSLPLADVNHLIMSLCTE